MCSAFGLCLFLLQLGVHDTDLKYVLTEGGPEQELQNHEQKGLKDDPEEMYVNAWTPGCIKVCQDLKPDIIVCDVFSRAGAMAADQMGIPSVLNLPGPLLLFKDFM